MKKKLKAIIQLIKTIRKISPQAINDKLINEEIVRKRFIEARKNIHILVEKPDSIEAITIRAGVILANDMEHLMWAGTLYVHTEENPFFIHQPAI